MSGSENGQDVSSKTNNDIKDQSSEVQRAASPAKRSAGEMEGTGKNVNGGEQPGSNDDVAMAGTENDMYDEDTGANSAATSVQGTVTTNTSATSIDSDDPPPYSNENTNGEQWKVAGGTSAPSLDDQVKEVLQLAMQPVEHGDRGFVVSMQWLAKVLSRTTENQNSTGFPKAAREGDIGPVDNSNIVPADAFEEPILFDDHKQLYIPLKEGLTMEEDFQVLPEKAWGLILGWYGITAEQKQITRYAHNTAPDDALMPNVVYELNPPVFLIRKVPQPADADETPQDKSRSAAIELGLKQERRRRGQMKPEDALMIVSSRQEKSHVFLRRIKEFAGIKMAHKVKIWRVLKPTNIAVDEPDNNQPGVASPPLSRGTSPSTALAERSKLVVDAGDWQKMEIGKDIEHIDMTDQTANPNYNGSSTIEIFSLFENQTLILEEQTRGPAGGEFTSDQKKKLLTKGKLGGSKPGSTVASRQASPAPGSTVTTRSRRRDGKTRGTVGLTNLGNTCYMNSALQCIRSVEELAIYFLQDKYKSEINANNVLGSGGVMAKRYAELLQGIYGDNASSSFSPTMFKKALSSQNPVFSGWGQQDSQEFLSYLVDSVHEDLNRIQKKPYLENPDSDDARVNDPEYIKELGDIYRSNHAQRNESVCMDLFKGFYKNTMECPTCDKVSVTFDPFASLTLQLPIESSVMHTFTFVPLKGSPVNHSLDLDKSLTVKGIKELIASKHDNVDARKLWMVEIYSHRMYKHFEDRTSVAEANIQGNDYIFVFELSDIPTNIPAPRKQNTFSRYSSYGSKAEEVPDMDSEMGETMAVPIFHRKKKPYGSGVDVTMHPQYITIKRDEAQDYDCILKKVLYAVAQVTSRPILVEAGQSSSGTANQNDGNSSEESVQDDAARVSDHSAASEDGYVSVSKSNGKRDIPSAGEMSQVDQPSMPTVENVPEGFFNPSYRVAKVLSDDLFKLNYAKGRESMLCTGTAGFEDKAVREMKTRVKVPSHDSTDSDTETSTTTGSSPANNEDEEESDEDGDTTAQTSAENSATLGDDDISDSDLPDDPLVNSAKPTRMRGNKKENKFKGNKPRKVKEKRLSKKEKKELKKARARASLGTPPSQQPADDEDDGPYYIKLGECIVLDWSEEAIASIFAGDRHDVHEINGHWLSDDDGRGLPLIHDSATEEKRNRREMRKKHGITLEDCFMETGKREKLSEDNAWYCNRCKELRQATKTLEIWNCPDIVVVHLKRFGGTRSFRDKIDVLVDYPIEGLDLTEKIGQKEDGKEYLYDLFAVDNHFGGLGGGHYTASAKNFFDGLWYDYNDSSVTKLGDSPRKSAAAYLLFYRRRSDKPLGPQYLQDLVTDFRNPPQQTNSADEAYESDSGEGRLGDPSSILRGSSSNLVGAGAGATNGLQLQAQSTVRGAGNGSAGQQAGQSLKPKSQATTDDEGIDMDDELPTLENEPLYGNNTGHSWGFETLDGQDNNADDHTEMLLNGVGNHPTSDNDADSNTAERDGDEDEDVDPWAFEFDDLGDWSSEPGAPTYNDNDPPQEGTLEAMGLDNHSMYSAVHDYDARGSSMHIEDVGDAAMARDDPPAVDITLSDEKHAKTD